MDSLLKHAQWYTGVNREFDRRVFRPPHPEVTNELVALWRKYKNELKEFSEAYAPKYREAVNSDFVATFGDIEGEFLYILIRELKPDLVYEISPNSGCSTNYLLAAVTRNGSGRVEGFEIEPSFNGVPTRDAIAKNQISLCDMSRYTLHIGDARKTVAEKLKTESPNFCLIDSWHEDVFAEFYVRELLPRVKGTVLVQDIAHFDPRPEWSTEAAYLLTYLQLTGTELVPIASYDDILNASGARNDLVPRRPKRSNSILLHLGQITAPSSPEPGLRYRDAWNGRADEERPAVCDILAMWYGKSPVSHRIAENLAAQFTSLDLCFQVLTLELLANSGHETLASRLLLTIDLTTLQGSQLPLFVARAAKLLGRIDIVEAMARMIHEAAVDPTIATGYRQLLELADLLYQCGRQEQARTTLNVAIACLKTGNFNVRKISVDLATFCLKHPEHFSQMQHLGLGRRQAIEAIAIAGRAMVRSAAVRAIGRLRRRVRR